MRLICPNCGAQYEVDASVIPAGGRDVQCSNCGHTWYQRAPSRPVEAAEAEQVHADVETAEAAETEQEYYEDADLAPEAAASASDEFAEDADEDEIEPETPPASARSALDPEVSGILQEEAQREQAERAAEQSLATQTHAGLGLDATDGETPPNVKERMARLRELDDELAVTAAAAAPVAGGRKDLLPDIEEINSSLTPDDDGADADELPEPVVAERARRAGFRRGFALAIIIFAIMTLLYLYAPQIVQMNPQTEPAMAAYVDWVNGLREAVNGFMARTAERLTALLTSMNSNG